MSERASTHDQHESGTRAVKRGVIWVVIAAGCFAVVAAAAMHTWQLVAVLGVEGKLHRAAEVAAREAMLPKADRSSVEQVAASRLRRDGLRAGRRAVTVEHGRGLSRRRFHVASADFISVTISLPTSAALPGPLVRWSALFGPEHVQATAERPL